LLCEIIFYSLTGIVEPPVCVGQGPAKDTVVRSTSIIVPVALESLRILPWSLPCVT
jgi:hypothetical protein